jgi:hypothetical protein
MTIETAIRAAIQPPHKGAMVSVRALDPPISTVTRTDGNVYNPRFSFPKDAKRLVDGSPKNSRSKTRFTRLLA